MSLPEPRWLSDVERLLPIRSQFALSGNIRDSFLVPLATGPAIVPLYRALWEVLKRHDYRLLLIYDPSEGLRAYPNEAAVRNLADKLFELRLAAGPQMLSLESLAGLMRSLGGEREARCALVLDFASRLARQPDHLSEGEHRFFVAAEKHSLSVAPIVPKEGGGAPLYNPTFWLLNRIQDLPSWFTLDSERVASLIIARPDYETRQAAASELGPVFTEFDAAPVSVREEFVKRFTEGTEGMSLLALSDITALATQQGLGMGAIDDAIRSYKIGALDNPWKKDYLREKIRHAEQFIEGRVKGQYAAIVKSLDILRRSVMGMTGAHVRQGGSRPRGVLFFAGPTGVGKTELAKTLTQLVFGDERAYLRFDMSEFAEEHTSARLLGAPPGYIGFDAGGELTNAVREKPFSLVLFDEIEKAHPRILDKFLQILEDGRLTDGRGDTAYFSEAIIVFTSNLGIYVEDHEGRRVQNVRPGDPYEMVESKVRDAIGDYFKYRLSRPEILNRIGDNIVVFNFITPDVAEKIFDGMLANVAKRLVDEFKLEIVLLPPVREALLARCTSDLSNGGRGIGNQLESTFINPLSRALFEQNLEGCRVLTIEALSERDKVVTLNVRAR
jgi:energy-coupling factor transporter ATP-binding protein EcfA2